MSKNIVLVGLMGSGKTTIGNLAAQKIGFKFIDTDHLIEKEAKKTVSEIFELYGEPLFRKLEVHAVQEISDFTQKVIATGGGIVERQENIDKLKKNGILFYLKATPEELFERIKDDIGRPLLKTNPKAVIKQLLEKREPLYKQADFEIITSNKQAYSIVDEIIEIYKQNA